VLLTGYRPEWWIAGRTIVTSCTDAHLTGVLLAEGGLERGRHLPLPRNLLRAGSQVRRGLLAILLVSRRDHRFEVGLDGGEGRTIRVFAVGQHHLNPVGVGR